MPYSTQAIGPNSVCLSMVSRVGIAALHTATAIDKEVLEKPSLISPFYVWKESQNKKHGSSDSICIYLLNKAIFGLGCLEFYQKMGSTE